MAIGKGLTGERRYMSKPLIEQLDQFKKCNNIAKDQKALKKIFKMAGIDKL
jgi:hypothetical protein